MRFGREGRVRSPLAGLLVAGTLPGVIVGAIVRVQWLSNSRDFTFIAAGVLLSLGLWLLTGNQSITARAHDHATTSPMGVGARTVVGGIHGIGGGSLLAPVLIGLGFSVYEVAPAMLAATFLTSIAGIATYQKSSSSATAAPSRPNGSSARPRCGRLRWRVLRRALAEPAAPALAQAPARLHRLSRRRALLPDGHNRTLDTPADAAPRSRIEPASAPPCPSGHGRPRVEGPGGKPKACRLSRRPLGGATQFALWPSAGFGSKLESIPKTPIYPQ
jgi:hypothetical protein